MISVIVPTLGNRLVELERLLLSLEGQTCNQFEVICVIQDNFEIVNAILSKFNFDVKVIKLNKLGLSNARNEALKLVGKHVNFVTLSDDDCWYPPYSIEKVIDMGKGFKGCLCFQIFDPIIKDYYKKYAPDYDKKLTLIKSLKVSSIEIFISTSVINSGINFDVRFGLGTQYPSGEENIFLFDIIKNDFAIKYFPEIIVYHLKPDWKKKEYIFKGKGALFVRLYNKFFAFFMVHIYALMKYRYSDNLLVDLKNMILEIRTFKR